MTQTTQRTTTGQRGFALVEIFLAVLVAGVVAAVLVPVVQAQRERGQDASAKAAVRRAYVRVETCRARRSDVRSCRAVAAKPVTLAATDANTYALSARSASGAVFAISKDAGEVVRSCTGGTAGCGGVAW